tara:strand:+ start:153 stop:770 length:618 start_codon:yes stop_codon:yes gene_type:complete
MAFSSKRVISSNFSSGSSTTTQSQLIRGTINQITANVHYGLHGSAFYYQTLNSDVGVTDWNSLVSRAQSLGVDTSQWDGTTLADNDKFFGWISWDSNDPSNPTQSQGISAAWTDNPPWLPIPVTIKKVEYYANVAPAGYWHYAYGHDKNPSTWQTTSENISNDSSAYTTNSNDLNRAMGIWYQYWRGAASNNTCDFIFDIQHPAT